MDLRYLIFVMVALAIISFVIRIIGEKRRRTDLEALAAELGLEFQSGGDRELRDRLSSFKLMSTGRSRRLDNLLRGQSASTTTAIFDYQYTSSSGKNSNTRRYTVFLMESDELRLPSFSLEPEGFLHRLVASLGWQDINFDTHPEFSRMYQLQGSDEESVRELFQPGVLEYFEQHKGLCVEGKGNQLIVYYQGKRPGVDAIPGLMQDGLAVVGMLREAWIAGS